MCVFGVKTKCIQLKLLKLFTTWTNYKYDGYKCFTFKSLICTVESRLASVRFTTIHTYDPCPVGPSTADWRCITVATKASFLYSVRFWPFSGVQVVSSFCILVQFF